MEDTKVLGFNKSNTYRADFKKFTFIALAAGIMISFAAGVSGAKEPAKEAPKEAPKETAKHEGHLSQNYILNMDPKSSSTIGKGSAEDVHAFFDDAEKAIEAKDLSALMGLYSENYTNGTHKKADAEITWKRLFADFDNLAMTHNMRFITADPKGNVIVMQCSGMLVGEPKVEKGLIALDSWMNSDHVLVKEGGKLKIIGSTGAEKKRLWFDKPMHPLF